MTRLAAVGFVLCMAGCGASSSFEANDPEPGATLTKSGLISGSYNPFTLTGLARDIWGNFLFGSYGTIYVTGKVGSTVVYSNSLSINFFDTLSENQFPDDADLTLSADIDSGCYFDYWSVDYQSYTTNPVTISAASLPYNSTMHLFVTCT